jgi:hypothetical protein
MEEEDNIFAGGDDEIMQEVSERIDNLLQK